MEPEHGFPGGKLTVTGANICSTRCEPQGRKSSSKPKENERADLRKEPAVLCGRHRPVYKA